MKKLIFILLAFISMNLTAQSPCQEGKIIINGSAVDAVLLENSNITGLKLPLWLEEGTTLAAGNRVQIISVIEFNVINQAGNISLGFNQVKSIGTLTQTVPAGTVWKVESIVKHENAFSTGFTASSNSPVCRNTQINLSAASVNGASYSWTGPNGFTSSQQNPVLSNAQLAASGTYSMTATLNGCTSAPITTDVVVNDLPVSTFTNTPTFVITNTNATFIPTVSGATYSWLFDSGNPSSSSSENPVVQWTSAGNYDVTLTVTDNNGCSSTEVQAVTVSNCTPGQPSSAFSTSPSSPKTGQTIGFIPVTTSGVTYDWTFTGGSTGSSNIQNPDVVWSSPGTYSASLTVTDGIGCSSSTTSPVVVTDPISITFNTNGTGSSGSIQSWTVPAGVTFIEIEANGARGGMPRNEGNTYRGLGARMIGSFSVTPGSVLKIVVGQEGTMNTSGDPANGGGCGGGGSFVWVDGQSTPLIVAGGGGGASITNYNSSTYWYGKGGTTGTDGLSSQSGVANYGTNGGNATYSSGAKGWNTMFSTLNFSGYSNNFGGNGGYGGGGAMVNLDHGGGGGGGYSGGGGGQYGYDSGTGNPCGRNGGGGGGSYNTGTNQTNTAGVNAGPGQVKINY